MFDILDVDKMTSRAVHRAQLLIMSRAMEDFQLITEASFTPKRFSRHGGACPSLAEFGAKPQKTVPRVTRCVCGKVAQNVAQSVFAKNK
jgi:hypothetical protein